VGIWNRNEDIKVAIEFDEGSPSGCCNKPDLTALLSAEIKTRHDKLARFVATNDLIQSFDESDVHFILRKGMHGFKILDIKKEIEAFELVKEIIRR
jgi:hypothetical protein